MQWQYIMCDRQVFCNVTQLVAKVKAMVVVDELATGIIMYGTRSPWKVNGTTKYKTTNIDQSIGVNVVP